MKLTDCPLRTRFRLIRSATSRMETFGFTPGTPVTLLKKRAFYPLIVRLPDGCYLIDRKSAAGTEVTLW